MWSRVFTVVGPRMLNMLTASLRLTVLRALGVCGGALICFTAAHSDFVLGAAYTVLTTREAEWYITSIVSVSLSVDNNFRKP